MAALLEIATLDITVSDQVLVRKLDLTIQRGSLVAVLGPNGVGKTLTLHTLAGLRGTQSGTVQLNGTDLRQLGHRDRALGMGLLLQEQEDPFPATVFQMAMMGRHARLGLWQWETAEDEKAVSTALEDMDLAGMAHRLSHTLSGGERRRLGIAVLLVQDPDLFLLDEPMNHLDPRHQFAVLDKLRDLGNKGKGVVASVHDPVLAARYFDFALLLHGDGLWEFGPAADLLDTRKLSVLYDVPFERYRRESDSLRDVIVLPVPAGAVSFSGRETLSGG